jgi:hypothetical protein
LSKKRLKPEDVKTMIARNAAAKIAPVIKRIDGLEGMLEGIQATLKAIQARLNLAPDNPAFEAMNSGLEKDPIADIRKSSLAKAINPLVFPENRRAVERVFAKRGWREGDTVESVLKEANGG